MLNQFFSFLPLAAICISGGSSAAAAAVSSAAAGPAAACAAAGAPCAAECSVGDHEAKQQQQRDIEWQNQLRCIGVYSIGVSPARSSDGKSSRGCRVDGSSIEEASLAPERNTSNNRSEDPTDPTTSTSSTISSRSSRKHHLACHTTPCASLLSLDADPFARRLLQPPSLFLARALQQNDTATAA